MPSIFRSAAVGLLAAIGGCSPSSDTSVSREGPREPVAVSAKPRSSVVPSLDQIIAVCGKPDHLTQGQATYRAGVSITETPNGVDIAFGMNADAMYFAAGIFTSRLFTRSEGEGIIDFIDEIGQEKEIGRFRIRIGVAERPAGYRLVRVSPRG